MLVHYRIRNWLIMMKSFRQIPIGHLWPFSQCIILQYHILLQGSTHTADDPCTRTVSGPLSHIPLVIVSYEIHSCNLIY